MFREGHCFFSQERSLEKRIKRLSKGYGPPDIDTITITSSLNDSTGG